MLSHRGWTGVRLASAASFYIRSRAQAAGYVECAVLLVLEIILSSYTVLSLFRLSRSPRWPAVARTSQQVLFVTRHMPAGVRRPVAALVQQ